MAMTAISGLVQPLQPAPVGVVPDGGATDFGAALTQAARDAASTVRMAETASVRGIAGDMPVQDVVSALMQAERTVQAALAVRDKLVGAFQEISRMQI